MLEILHRRYRMNPENLMEQVVVRLVINGLGRAIAWAWPRTKPSLEIRWHQLQRDLGKEWQDFLAWPWLAKVGWAVMTGLVATVVMWPTAPLELQAVAALPPFLLMLWILAVKAKRRLVLCYSRN